MWFSATKDEVQGWGFIQQQRMRLKDVVIQLQRMRFKDVVIQGQGCGYSRTGMWLFKDRDVVIQGQASILRRFYQRPKNNI